MTSLFYVNDGRAKRRDMTRKIRVVVAGVDAPSMAKIAEEAGGGLIEAVATGDMQGARLVKKGQVDYYLGTCWSGGGGALAAATAILGAQQVGIAGTPGMSVTEERVVGFLAESRNAFGFPYEQSKQAIPIIIQAILRHHAPRPAEVV
jgi:hypothetical protein